MYNICMAIRMRETIVPSRNQLEFPFEPEPYISPEERFADLPPAVRNVAVTVERERETLRLALLKAESVGNEERRERIAVILHDYADMTWREIAEVVASLELSGKRILQDGSPNIPFSEAARIAVARLNHAWRVLRREEMTAQLAEAMDVRNPDTIRARLQQCPEPQRSHYIEIGRQLTQLSGLELLSYAASLGLTNEETEQYDWIQNRDIGRDSDEWRRGGEWAFGGPHHVKHVDTIRRGLFVHRLNHMIMAGLTPQQAADIELAERRNGMADVIERFRAARPITVARRIPKL
jgi:hypothetical protein